RVVRYAPHGDKEADCRRGQTTAQPVSRRAALHVWRACCGWASRHSRARGTDRGWRDLWACRRQRHIPYWLRDAAEHIAHGKPGPGEDTACTATVAHLAHQKAQAARPAGARSAAEIRSVAMPLQGLEERLLRGGYESSAAICQAYPCGAAPRGSGSG